ncbi:hypothetical protein GCM10010172_17610 [Paractinoplanes ferrugineus]|uniref:Uncharacterized protein n=1 Tax=Paractinoplanes ferrugineus TaxID=113564 RepID=A0A919J937_9ACTN|nr:hypothetical protein Afe05nite_67890 [Actinoplanes ferrugineus]
MGILVGVMWPSGEFPHNSWALGLFDEILHSAHATMPVVELIGGGIAAEARCHLVLPEEDKRPHDDPAAVVIGRASAFADRVAELCGIEDDLAGQWSRQVEQSEPARFEAALRDIVRRLEGWPGHFEGST